MVYTLLPCFVYVVTIQHISILVGGEPCISIALNSIHPLPPTLMDTSLYTKNVVFINKGMCNS